MRCPNCSNEMKYRNDGCWGFPFSTGPEPDYPEWIPRDVYFCNDCRIRKVNEEWTIPKKYAPTEKQKNTILFINNRLKMKLEALTKHQCWLDIGRYFEEAKQTQVHSDEYYEDLQDYFGMDASDFY